jgi:hypothetical protein
MSVFGTAYWTNARAKSGYPTEYQPPPLDESLRELAAFRDPAADRKDALRQNRLE